MKTLALKERKSLYKETIESIIDSIGEIKHNSISYWDLKTDFSDPFVHDCSNETIENIDEIINNIKGKPRVLSGTQDRTYYTVGMDKITIVEKKYFNSIQHYYWGLIHEHAHWTGDLGRLEREMFGIPEFFMTAHGRAFEEVIAELTTRFIFELTGNMTDELKENNVNYIRNMTVHLKDVELIREAGKEAMKAVEFILTNKKPKKKKEEESIGSGWNPFGF